MTNQVLYRKYRPKKFSEVIGQEHVKMTLTNAISSQRIAHAYLFTGPRGVGKTTIARIIARAINCTKVANGEPCNACDICQEFINGASLDIMEIDAASHTGVDNIREIIDHLKFSPAKAKYKVIIIDEVHMLSKGAFNALLKSLEEPPVHAVFVLATTEIHKVPATIISRTQRFDFKKISISDLVQLLKFVVEDNKRKITEEAINEITAAADGSFRDALSLLDQVLSFSEKEITEDVVEQVLGLTGNKTTGDFLELLIKNETKLAVNFISNLVYSGRDLYQFQKDFLEYLRKVLLIKVGSFNSQTVTKEAGDKMQSLGSALKLERLLVIIDIFQKAGGELKWASIPSLPLEIAAVEVTNGFVNNIEESEDSSVIASEVKQSETKNLSQKSDPIASGLSDEPLLQDDKKFIPDFGSGLFTKVKEHWPEVLEKVKDYNHSLISSLKLAEFAEIRNNYLILLFPYKFHKDAIDARKNRLVLDQVLEEVLGIKLMVKPMIKKEYENGENELKKENLVQSAMKIMGGEMEK